LATCTACTHAQREVIDAAILQNTPYRAVASKFELSRDVVGRHARRHLRHQIAFIDADRRLVQMPLEEAKRARELLETRVKAEKYAIDCSEDVLNETRHLYQKALTIMEEAERTGNSPVALRALREARETLVLFGRAYKMFDEGGTTIDRSTKILTILGQTSEADLRRLLTEVAAA